MPEIVIADPQNDSDFERLIDLDARGFGAPRDRSARWVEAARNHLRFRMARIGDEAVGMYALIRAGQFYGGHSVPVDCVVAVAVSPMWRRRGLAAALMRDLVRVADDDAAALAPLYAATVSLYRRWGWEVVDRALQHGVRTGALASLRAEGEPVDDPAAADIEALRRTFLPRWDGPLDRPDWWSAVEAVFDAPPEHLFLHGWSEQGRLTGYMRYRYTSESRVVVEEFVATTGDALCGLLALLAGNESLHQEVSFHSCLQSRNDLLFVLADASKSVTTTAGICWMQRIVNVPRALQARGWAAHATARIELEVADPASGDSERFVLEVANGGAEVTRGGAGAVRCGVGALSSWYAGALRAADGPRLGLMEGDDAALQAMDDLIERRPVWMPDHF